MDTVESRAPEADSAAKLETHPSASGTQTQELCSPAVTTMRCELFDAAPIGCFLVNAHGQILDVNLAGAVLLREDRDRLVLRQLAPFVAEVDRERFTTFCRAALQTTTRQTDEFTLRVAQQSRRVLIDALACRSPASGPTAVRLAVTDVDERLRATEAVQQTEERYRALVEAADFGITFIDLSYNLLMVNPKSARMFGKTSDTLIGQKCYSAFRGRQTPCDNCAGLKALTNCCPAESESLVEPKDGPPFFVRIKASPVLGRDGKPVGFIEVAEDITDQRRAEEKIAWLARLPQENPHPVLRIGGDGTILYCNKASAPLLESWNCREGDFLPSTWRHVMLDAIHSRTVHQTECECGSQIFELTFAPIPDAGYANLYAADITKRKRAYKALRESEERYRRLFEVESDALLLSDCETGRFFDVNAAAMKLYGYTREEFLRLRPVDISAEPTKTRHAIAARDSNISLHWHRKKDGAVFPVEIVGNVFEYQGRQVLVAAIRDVTERRRVEEDLLRATRMAEAASRAKSEFLANMSHEIRTPMTAILGFAELLTDADLSREERTELVDGIRRNGQSLLGLVGDILDLSRIEAEKLTLEKTDCSLRPIVDDAVSAVRARAEEKRLKLNVDWQPSAPVRIHTDPARLRQILLNLLGNAVKFTEHGNVRLAVRSLSDAQQPSRVQLAVSDSGIGIDRETIATLFKPFVQADASATRRYGGAGLGLAISQRLAAALGGQIEVASEPGKGSTFTLTIDAGPLTGADVAAPQPPAAIAQGIEPSCKDVATPLCGRLLLAEDDPSIQRLMALLLRKMGLKVEVAGNGLAACEQAEQSRAEGRPFDLILLDIQMPELNGYQAARRLRRQGWPGPIIALTAHAMAGDREKCIDAGCDSYVTKPIDSATLRQILEHYLTAPAEDRCRVAT